MLPVISATGIEVPAVTAVPLFDKVPAPGSVVILTANNVFAGESFGSLNPKSVVANVTVASSFNVIVLSVPAGASLTELTVIDMVSESVSEPLSVDNTTNEEEPLKLAVGW